MVVYGTLKDGVVVLDQKVDLPEGVRVRVDIEAPADDQRAVQADQQPTVWQELAKLSGIIDTGRRDGSVNHDHYIYGTPKREPNG